MVEGQDFVPYVPADKSIPEFTLKAIIVGTFLSVFLGVANLYLGLYVGMTVCASIPAAVIGMAILRGLKGNILENNIAQTAGSAGEALAAGVIFTMPALLMAGLLRPDEPAIWSEVPYWTTILILIGGYLGVIFTFSVRKAMMKDPTLPYPEGVACAETLKSGERGGSTFKVLMEGLGIGALVRLFTGPGSFGFWKPEGEWMFKLPTAHYAGRTIGGPFYFNMTAEPLLLGVGFIIGPSIAVWIFTGAVLGFWVLTPIVAAFTVEPAALDIGAFMSAWRLYVRPMGIGAMLVGAVWTLLNIRSAISTSFKEAFVKGKKIEKVPRTELSIPVKCGLLFALVLALITIGVYFYGMTSGAGLSEPLAGGRAAAISVIMVLVMIVAAFIFTAVSGYITGQVGSSNNPISGMTLATLLITCGVLYLAGLRGETGVVAAVLVIAVACTSMGIAGDTMQDLKTGYLLGATPKNQQIAEIIGVTAMAFFAVPVLNTLNSAYGIGIPTLEHPNPLSAPQGALVNLFTTSVFTGEMAWILILVGAAIAIMLILFNKPVLPVAIGIYLPFYLAVGIFIGGVIRWIADKLLKPKPYSEEVKSAGINSGVIASAGLVGGGAITGVIIAWLITIMDQMKVEGASLGLELWNPGIAVSDLWLPLVISAVIIIVGAFMVWSVLSGAKKEKSR